MTANAKNLIQELTRGLNERQVEIIQKRFGLFGNTTHTLAVLGKEYNITRERVRQIESSALQLIKKNLKESRQGGTFLEVMRAYLASCGGARREIDIVSDLHAKKTIVSTDKKQGGTEIAFLLAASGAVLYHKEDSDFHSFWYGELQTMRRIASFTQALAEKITNKKADILHKGAFRSILAKEIRAHTLSEHIADNYLSLSKLFNKNPYGDIGLSSWSEIMPKTMRDRAYLILRKRNAPLHFQEIARAINLVPFGDKKRAHPSTIHNELIKDPRFVLVGRGIYALAEHGYTPGTAKEVIARILQTRGPLTAKHIIQLVQKERLLQENTILLNLQNKNLFKKLPGGAYHINTS